MRDTDKEWLLENEQHLQVIIELRLLRRRLSRLALAVTLLSVVWVLHSILWVIRLWS